MKQNIRKQIIAMGGGGFSMEPENKRLDRYILKQSKADRPRICFIPTASGDSDGYIERFYTAFQSEECEPTHLSLFSPPKDLEIFVEQQDVFYVGGGNTKNLLALWKEWGLDVLLKKAYEDGKILAGLSAGSLCWFEEGVTDSFGPLAKLDCLGFISGSHCPHYDGEKERRPAYHKLIENGLKPGYAADDGAGLHFVNGELYKVVSSRDHAKGYFVEYDGENVNEVELETLFLK
ncbi:peptidase E [Fictibacillus phosphorivorans]|uniref:Type 1 glutamine amidotransferase-like domain-containing protein n=1 Tax=Fictibacillus phosphorivorans TaxID=1221500 RepID=UPI001293EA1B|nr:peptidase E [Fictibacillus phosphorivorans]MQR95035.1 peptidase E [Fictibacillus phosphorivorans]